MPRVFCAVGVRAYNGARILSQNGFSNVKACHGNARFYKSTNSAEPDNDTPAPLSGNSDRKEERAVSQQHVRKITIDCCGMQCPGPIKEVFKTVNPMKK